MKKFATLMAFAFFALTIQAQETPAKEKTKKEARAAKKEAGKEKSECKTDKTEGKKCCSSKKTK